MTTDRTSAEAGGVPPRPPEPPTAPPKPSATPPASNAKSTPAGGSGNGSGSANGANGTSRKGGSAGRSAKPKRDAAPSTAAPAPAAAKAAPVGTWDDARTAAPAAAASAAAAPRPAAAAQPQPVPNRSGATAGRQQQPAAARPRQQSPAPQVAQAQAQGPAPRTRRARLKASRVDPWSVMKVSFLLSVALGVVTVVAVTILWLVLDGLGVFNSLANTVKDVTQSSTNSGFDLKSYLSLKNTMLFSFAIAVIDVILVTALATLSAFLYNLSASFSGGVEITLSEED